MKFSKNIGSADRAVRLIISLVLFALAYWKSSWLLFAIAVFIFFEAAAGWCILYQILGKNSCAIPKK